MRNKRNFYIKVLISNLVYPSLLKRAKWQSCYVFLSPLWFVSVLSALLILRIFGNQLPFVLACVRVMANYQLQPMERG